jgi:hypothetical protein
MEENPRDPQNPPSPPRRFVYRLAEPDASISHPLRRSTDTPCAFRGIPGQLCPNPLLLKFRVYLKLN